MASFSSTPSATMLTVVPFTMPRESTPRRLFAFTRRSSLSIQMLLLNSLAFWMKKGPRVKTDLIVYCYLFGYH